MFHVRATSTPLPPDRPDPSPASHAASTHRRDRHTPRRTTLAVGMAGLLVAGAATAAAAAPITTPGPLTSIEISPDLNCAVRYAGDAHSEFYGDTACATLVAAGGVLYGPVRIPAGSSASPRTGWIPVSQESTGSGSASDPYVVTTTVSGGEALSLTQTDVYVTGENAYRTTITLSGSSAQPVDAVIYHAGDCYLQNSDDGFGEHNPTTGAITCRAPDEAGNHSDETRIEEFVPLTASSNFLYSHYNDVWAAVGSRQPLPDEVRNGDVQIDNGIALSWSKTVSSSASATVSLLTNFSPTGVVPLPSSITADDASVGVGDVITLTVSVDNPNIQEQVLSALTVTVPDGFEYVPGSTVGQDEPTVTGGTLEFSGIDAIAPDAQANLTLQVTAVSAGTGSAQVTGQTESGAPVIESSVDLEVAAGPGPQPSVSPSASPSASPSVSPSASPSVSPSVSPSASPSTSASPSVSPTPSPSLTSASATPSTSSSAPAGGLADTGVDGGGLLAAGILGSTLLAAGTALTVSRRRAGSNRAE